MSCKNVYVILKKVFIITGINDYSKGNTIGLNTEVLLLKNVWNQNT